jgi:hypothetical protein
VGRYAVTLSAQTAGAGDAIAVCNGAVQTVDDGGGSPSGIRCLLVPPPGFATVTGVVTNNATISFRQVRAGAVIATPASVTLAVGTNLVAETPLVVPLVAPAAFRPDDLVDIVMHQNGTGLAIGAGVVAELEIYGR